MADIDSPQSVEECPPWCVVTDHLDFRLKHEMSDYWHQGAPIEVLTTDTDHNWNEIYCKARLIQQMHAVGPLQYVAEPIEVELGNALTPANARRLATALMDLANQAEGT